MVKLRRLYGKNAVSRSDPLQGSDKNVCRTLWRSYPEVRGAPANQPSMTVSSEIETTTSHCHALKHKHYLKPNDNGY